MLHERRLVFIKVLYLCKSCIHESPVFMNVMNVLSCSGKVIAKCQTLWQNHDRPRMLHDRRLVFMNIVSIMSTISSVLYSGKSCIHEYPVMIVMSTISVLYS